MFQYATPLSDMTDMAAIDVTKVEVYVATVPYTTAGYAYECCYIGYLFYTVKLRKPIARGHLSLTCLRITMATVSHICT